MGGGGGQPTVGLALQPPAALVHGAMMGPAQQGQVGQVGGAAVQPVPQMVGLTPGRGPLAAGKRAAAVADGQGGALGGLDDPAGAADLQRLGRGAAEDRGQQRHRRPQPGRQPLIAAGGVVVGAMVGGAVVGGAVTVTVNGPSPISSSLSEIVIVSVPAFAGA